MTTPKELAELAAEAAEMEAAAKIASKNGMFESGSILRSKAAGIRRAIEILTTVNHED